MENMQSDPQRVQLDRVWQNYLINKSVYYFNWNDKWFTNMNVMIKEEQK